MIRQFNEQSQRRIAESVRAYERGAAEPARLGMAQLGASVWFVITGATELSTGKWEYDVQIQIGGDTSSHDGFRDAGCNAAKARNTWERATNAGYENASVTSIKRIPNGVPLKGEWSVRDGEPLIVFCERNEPSC